MITILYTEIPHQNESVEAKIVSCTVAASTVSIWHMSSEAVHIAELIHLIADVFNSFKLY